MLDDLPKDWVRPDLWLRRHARLQPGKPALLFREAVLSYADLWRRSSRLAAGLAAEGVRPLDPVVCISPNHPAFLELYFACSLLGALFVPLNARLAAAELLFQIQDVRSRFVVLGPGLEALPGELERCGWKGTARIFQAGSDARDPAEPYERLLREVGRPAQAQRSSSPDDPQMILFTSGTAGVPKGALLPYRKTLFNSLNAEIFFDLGPEDRALVPVPLFHSLGLNILSVPALFRGATVILQEKFDEASTLALMERNRATFMGAVPTIYRRLLEAGLERHDLSSLRFCFTAGAPIDVAIIHEFHRRGILLKQGYGQTETSILCCLDSQDAIRKAGSVGKPVVHAEVKVVDPSHREVRPGEIGEIVARGPIAMLGYWERPEETREVFRDGWLHTRDLGTIDDEGFITLVGRKGDMFISGGENVYPEQIERVYRGHPRVPDIAVFGIPDPDLGEVGVAYIVADKAGALPSAADLRAYAQGKIARYKIPRHFLFVDDFPRTVTGKVQKYRLRQMHLQSRQ
ncbi:MAG: AMP-binding protein [bacterium]